MKNSAVILNSADHTIADLPVNIICNIFQGFRGRDLIGLTEVCSSFNEAIGKSSSLMDKIQLKANNSVGERLFELNQVFSHSERTYQHLKLIGFDAADFNCSAFFRMNPTWLSLKLVNCNFKGSDLKDTFLPIAAPKLEELEYITPSMDSLVFQGRPPSPKPVNFPKLKKLKCGLLGSDMLCTSLKSLEFVKDSSYSSRTQERNLNLLKTNRGLEELTIPYDLINEIFLRSFKISNIHFKLKKLELQKQMSESMEWQSNQNFHTLLKMQKDSLEELTIEWFSGAHRICLPQNLQQLVAGQGFVLQIQLDNPGMEPQNDICVRSLNSVFSEFKVIRKLIIADKKGFLANKNVPNVAHLNLIPNTSITELRLRFDKSTTSNEVFKKLVAACPNLKNLIVREIDQTLLEFCSLHLKNLEHIYALSFKATSLPSPLVKFVKLKRVSFCESVIINHPELQEMKLVNQKHEILKMIS